MKGQVNRLSGRAQDPCEPATDAAYPREKTPAAIGVKPEQVEWSGLLSANGSVVVWLVFLGFGGTLLSLYYANIHYFPELEWKESLTYLAALSLLGGSIAILYGLLLYVPGIMWSEFLIHDSELEERLCYPGRGHEPCYWSVGKHLGLPFLGFMAVMHVAALFGFWVTALSAFGLLTFLSGYLWKRFRDHLKNKRHWVTQAQERQKTLLLKYVAAFDLSAVASLISVLLLYRLVQAEADAEKVWPMLLICTVVVTTANLFVAVQHRDRPWRSVMTAILFALTLLACGEIVAEGEAAVSTRLMEKFGVGERVRYTLVLSPQGRQVLENLKIIPPADPPGGVAVVERACILSRLGKEYYVEVGGRRVALSREQVLSWSVDPPRSAAPAPRPKEAPP